MASGLRSPSPDPVDPAEWHSWPAGDDVMRAVAPLPLPDNRWRDERELRGAADDESQPGDRDEPCDDRELRLLGELDDWAERGVLLVRLVADCGLLERELEPPGDKVLERSREPDVDLDRDRDGTEAEEAG